MIRFSNFLFFDFFRKCLEIFLEFPEIPQLAPSMFKPREMHVYNMFGLEALPTSAKKGLLMTRRKFRLCVSCRKVILRCANLRECPEKLQFSQLRETCP